MQRALLEQVREPAPIGDSITVSDFLGHSTSPPLFILDSSNLCSWSNICLTF